MDFEILEGLSLLRSGVSLMKCRINQVDEAVINRLSDTYDELCTVQKQGKSQTQSHILPLWHIESIEPALESTVHTNNVEANVIKWSDLTRGFTLVLRNINSSLDFLAPTAKSVVLIQKSLMFLINRLRLDADKTDLIEYINCSNFTKKLLHRSFWKYLNAIKTELLIEGLSKEDIEKAIYKSNGRISDQKTSTIFEQLTSRKDIIDLCQRVYSNNRKCGISSQLTANQIFEIFRRYILINIDIDEIKSLAEYCELNEHARKFNRITPKGLTLMLLQPQFSLIDMDRASNVYQDMNKPLTDYFISTSHNTYLLGHQRRGKISIQGYVQTLLKNGRCVELDVVDGDEGEPKICHKNTPTEKFAFSLKDTLLVIKEVAFITSPFPVILNIQNECTDLTQQRKMVETIEDIFSDCLADMKLFRNEPLPSPEMLKYKIVVRARVNTKVQGTIDESMERIAHIVNISWKDTTVAKLEQFKSASISEIKAYFMDHQMLRKFTNTNLCRVYPLGLRTDSSNFDAGEIWINGCQLVAINFQTKAKTTWSYNGYFRNNGNCGYVLRPKSTYFTELNGDNDSSNMAPSLQNFKKCVQLSLTIISGQRVTSIRGKRNPFNISPYVTVEISGNFPDRSSKSTECAKFIGVSPYWNQTFNFTIKDDCVCVVLLMVYCNSSRVNSYASIPLSIMLPGYHHVALVRASSREPLLLSSLFVHCQIVTTNL
ncbi:hypothetical protein GJ496_005658 [Pomphorhynchus laevis]|nr:hypothetical protein GJ496_005658 [Pomphorhynchus laevis]